MYNDVWNRFARKASTAEVAQDQTTLQAVAARPSTFHEKGLEGELEAVETVDTSGSTLSVDAIREAFNKDNFNKVKAMYGSRYVDYLASVGVQADWSILEEPELIAPNRS